jgi:hypothetical protein
LIEHYRGHRIQLVRARLWDAIIVDTATGATLPTKACALLQEGRAVAVSRARELIDLYLGASAGRSRAA